VIVLCVCRVDERKTVFVRVDREYEELVLACHGRSLQEPGSKPDVTKLFHLLGGGTKFTVSKKLGEVLPDSPSFVASDHGQPEVITLGGECVTMVTFWYD
jgi:hypothetical protein